MNDKINEAADIILNSSSMIALTGAGMSVESGIPDFRSAGGLWDKYDPAIYASIDSFIKKPVMVWEMIFDMVKIVQGAKPNPGHKALADIEAAGLLKCIVTQNIDNLHQEAGSKNVIEYHGNSSTLICTKCGMKYSSKDFDVSKKVIPECKDCKKFLKPDVIFFGEAIPQKAMKDSELFAREADVVLVVGTSAIVYPAASIPIVAKQKGAKIIEINIEETELTKTIADVHISGKSGEVLPQIAGLVISG